MTGRDAAQVRRLAVALALDVLERDPSDARARALLDALGVHVGAPPIAQVPRSAAAQLSFPS